MGGRPERDPRNNGFEQHIISSKGQAEKAILGEALTIHYYCIRKNRDLIWAHL